ncbi:hypothetical protein Y1Q_0004601 [Alligator mississippiensis]|uniref:Uncharacterized protein n=1 Tax=Alligator mississippiensis TaxID=8496 RepID=A0A151MHZ7_ALLMI|nr:hypothetical protein Y1Q_0004601 [Alligator mississippiensis]
MHCMGLIYLETSVLQCRFTRSQVTALPVPYCPGHTQLCYGLSFCSSLFKISVGEGVTALVSWGSNIWELMYFWRQ